MKLFFFVFYIKTCITSGYLIFIYSHIDMVIVMAKYCIIVVVIYNIK